MTGLVFRLKGEPEERLDLSPLIPERLDGLTSSEIQKLGIGTTKRDLKLGDVFDVSGADVSDIRFEGGSARLDKIGLGLSKGSIRVEGDVGFRCGRAMRGGAITVTGSAGDLAGSAMEGGELVIQGSAGARLGGPEAGETKGMSGGAIRVQGSADERAADRMRRGTIVIDGDCGLDAASRMIAGTLIVGGKAKGTPGRLMKRGTLILAGGAERLAPTFLDCGPQDLIILRLMARAIGEELGAVPFDGSPMRRYGGDTAVLGMGEVFLPLR